MFFFQLVYGTYHAKDFGNNFCIDCRSFGNNFCIDCNLLTVYNLLRVLILQQLRNQHAELTTWKEKSKILWDKHYLGKSKILVKHYRWYKPINQLYSWSINWRYESFHYFLNPVYVHEKIPETQDWNMTSPTIRKYYIEEPWHPHM